MTRHMLAVTAVSAGLLVAGSAGAAPVTLSRANGASVDQPGETAAAGDGFALAYQRSRPDAGNRQEIRIRRFTAAGAPSGKLLTLQSVARFTADPTVIAHGASGVVGLWFRGGDGIVARTGDTTTGVLGSELTVGKPAEALLDAVRLSNGRLLVAAYRADVSDPANPRKRLAITTLGGAPLKVTRASSDVLGAEVAFAASTAAPDFAVVGTAGGGAVAIYRDRTGGDVWASPVSPTGVASGTRRQVNGAKMPLGSSVERPLFAVDAAVLASGKIAVTWTRIGGTVAEDAFDVRYRLLDATGVPLGKDQLASAARAGRQTRPQVLPLADGRFVIGWVVDGSVADGSPRSYVLRTFKADGTAEGAERVVRKAAAATSGATIRLAPAADGLMLIHARGSSPATLRGLPDTP